MAVADIETDFQWSYTKYRTTSMYFLKISRRAFSAKSMAILKKTINAMTKWLGKKLRNVVKYDLCEARLKWTHRA